jgi:hypothetical protein
MGCLVRADSVRALAGASASESGHPDGFQDRLELRGITPLPGRDQYRQRLLPLLDREVDLGGQAAPGSSEPMVGRLDGNPAGRLFLGDPPFRRSGGVLVSPAEGRVDTHVPGDQALRVRLGLESGDDLGPGAIPLPAPDQVIDPIPRPVPFWHIPPWGTGPGPPPYAVYQLPPRPQRRTARLDALRQQRLQPDPLAIRQITTFHDA